MFEDHPAALMFCNKIGFISGEALIFFVSFLASRQEMKSCTEYDENFLTELALKVKQGRRKKLYEMLDLKMNNICLDA